MNTTAKLTLTVLFGLTSAAASFADTTQTTIVTTTSPAPVVVVVRDGFTEEHSQVMITRNGVTRLVSDNMRLHNGIVVRPDGIVIVPGVTNKTLHAGDWLAFDGTLTRADSGKVEYLQPER